MSDQTFAPGWYPDPWHPGALRWYDGTQWTPNAAAAPGYAGGDRYDGEKGANAARWGRVGFLVRAGAAGLQAVIAPVTIGRTWDQMMESFDDPSRAETVTGDTLALQLLGQVVALAGFVALILVLLWCYRATKNGRLLGMQTTYGPGMAVGGWLIPFANFVIPYQVVRDLFPVGHPNRRRAGLWWALEMGGIACVIGAYVVAITVGSGAGVAVGLVAAALAVTAGTFGARLCVEAEQLQASIARGALA